MRADAFESERGQRKPLHFVVFVKISQKITVESIMWCSASSYSICAASAAPSASFMLLQYSIDNFLSFKDQATLSMLASKRRAKQSALDLDAVFNAGDDLRLLKCAVVYGANNSGKSNIVKSLAVLKSFILNSSRESQAGDPIKVTPFLLSPTSEHGATSFEIIFIQEGYLYQYELSVTSLSVVAERLSRKAVGKGSAVLLFERDSDAIKVGRSFKEGKALEGKTRSNASFLSVCANFDGPIATSVLRWFGRLRIISGLADAGLAWTTNKLDEPDIGDRIQTLLRSFDLGIDRYEQGDEVPGFQFQADVSGTLPPEAVPVVNMLNRLNRAPSRKVVSYHKMFTDDGQYIKDIPFDLAKNESAGTKKLVALAGYLIAALEGSFILVIDEFDSRLHAKVSKMILGMFNSSEMNPLGSQLIAATHDTNLLDGEVLRRDQIWFADRDSYGRSSLTSLVEYKVRNDASFEKNYLNGEYGGVPFLRLGSLPAKRLHAAAGEDES